MEIKSSSEQSDSGICAQFLTICIEDGKYDKCFRQTSFLRWPISF